MGNNKIFHMDSERQKEGLCLTHAQVPVTSEKENKDLVQ